MLVELRVRELGVIADLDVVLGPGLTALTGETGAGKTLVVDALSLLLGGRADGAVVRSGAPEALVEGRFVDEQGEEVVLARAVPASGRSRGFVDGRMASVALLAETGSGLVDLYGQHEHQSLVRPTAQRQALDRFAGVDLGPVRALRRAIADLDAQVDALGGDDATRARELDLLAYELAEIDGLEIASADEDETLAEQEAMLADATALRDALVAAHGELANDAPAAAGERARAALRLLEQHEALAGHASHLRSVLAEMDDVASELRRAAEVVEEDPERLAWVRERRERLRRVVRKHGENLGDVLAFAESARRRAGELVAADETRSSLAVRRSALVAELEVAENAVGAARRRAAPALARQVEQHFGDLALAGARLEVALAETGPADDVELLLASNPGEPFQPLARAASGGELARTMLALRLVLTAGPPTLVFDEVDAGIGGAAALAVGRALAELALERQVLVVTHLAQVAAYADSQIAVAKVLDGGRSVTIARPVEGDERLAELARMLSGHPDSATARRHAAEILVAAGRS
jgi:DNA repair protein RecN (Recombination protein N)